MIKHEIIPRILAKTSLVCVIQNAVSFAAVIWVVSRNAGEELRDEPNNVTAANYTSRHAQGVRGRGMGSAERAGYHYYNYRRSR